MAIQYLVFKFDGMTSLQGEVPLNIPPDCNLKIWLPGLVRPVPSGLPLRKYPYFLFLWVIHVFDCLKGKGYVVYTLYQHDRLIHYCGVAPRCFKYSFMKGDDLIIGPVWTAPENQRKGIAKTVIQKVLRDYACSPRTFWYVSREENMESDQLVQSCGFQRTSRSTVVRRLGLRVHSIGNCSDKIR